MKDIDAIIEKHNVPRTLMLRGRVLHFEMNKSTGEKKKEKKKEIIDLFFETKDINVLENLLDTIVYQFQFEGEEIEELWRKIKETFKEVIPEEDVRLKHDFWQTEKLFKVRMAKNDTYIEGDTEESVMKMAVERLDELVQHLDQKLDSFSQFLSSFYEKLDMDKKFHYTQLWWAKIKEMNEKHEEEIKLRLNFQCTCIYSSFLENDQEK